MNHVPTSSEDVIIPGGTLLSSITINVNTNANCKSLTVNSGVGAVTININSGRSLTVTNTLTVNGSTGALTNNTINVGAETITAGSIVMNTSGTARITASSGTINVNGSIAMNGSATANQINFTGAGTMNLTGDMNSGGAFSPGTSTVNLTGGATQYIGGATTNFFNLTVNKNVNSNTVYNNSNALSISNNFQITKGVFVASATNANFLIGGNLVVNNSGTLTHDVDWDSYGKLMGIAGNVSIDGKFQYLSRSHVQLTGTGTVNVRTGANSSSSFAILTLQSGNFYASGDLRIDDNFWAMFGTSGSFHTNGQDVYANASLLNAGGTVFVDGGSLNVTNGILLGYSTAGSMNISSGALNTDFIYVGNGTTAGSVTHSGGTANISGSLTLGSAGTYTCSGSPSINISGDWINNNGAGAFVPASSTVTFNSSSTTQTITGTATSQNFGNITVAKPGQTLTVSGSTTSLDLGGNLLISSGTFDAGTASNLYVGGNFTNNGSGFNAGTGRVIFDGSSAQAINGSTQTNFYNLRVNNSGTGIDLSSQNLVINGTGAGALDFQNGKINTGALAVIIASSSATITNAAAGKYVNGYLRMAVQTGSPAKVFEIGDATTYSPVNIVFNNVTVAGLVTINTVAGDHPNITTSLVDETRSVNRYWDIVNNGITVTNFSPKFVYQSGDMDAIANPLIFRIGRYTGFWSYPTISARNATSITASVSLFGAHVVGEAATGAPTITSQPADQTVCGGTSTTFTAAANAKPNCTAVWQYSTDGGNNFTTVPLGAPYSVSASTTSNITTSVLTINPAAVSMNGYLYRAIFSNNRGSTPSFDSRLTVSTSPIANAGSTTSPICGTSSSAPLGGSIGGAATSGVWSSNVGGTFSPNANSLNATWTAPAGFSGTATLTLTASGGACSSTTDSKTQVVASSVSPVNVSPASASICVNAIQTLTANNNLTVTQSASTTVAIPNNNANGANNAINISGIPAGATIQNISVTFNVTHPKVNDLVMNLTAPNGNTINLANRLGSTGANFTNTTVSSSSITAFTTASPPYTGTFQASAVNAVGANGYVSNTTSFSSLYSTPNGSWTLSARDAANLNSGSLTSWSITITYSMGETITWSPATNLYTNAAATVPYTGTNLSTVYYKSATAETVTYTATATSVSGCTSSNTLSVTSGPVINIVADYCYGGGKIQLSASSTPAATSWLWNTGTTTSSILVDIAGLYSVTATTAAGCTNTKQASIAQELITNGDFSAGNTGFSSSYSYATPVSGALYPENTYTVYSNPNFVHNNFWGRDHTTNTGNMLIVNGSGTTPPPAVWQQTVSVQPNTDYYFSAYAISLNNVAPFANLQFKVNGTQVGTTTGTLPSRANNNNPPYNYTRFYGTWNSGSATTATVAIVDLETATGGNDFGLDDISFGTLSTFITLTSTTGTDAQTVCKNSSITPIVYNVGSGSAGPTVTGLPPGVSSDYNGVNLTISGAPTALGVYTYTLTTTGTCNPVTSTGTITVNEETITLTSAAGTVNQTACYGLPVTNITYNLGGASTGATVTGLPAGVTGSVSGTTLTISGSPSVIGTYNFTITTEGPCVHVSSSGTMTVNGPTIVRTSANGTNTQTVCKSTSIVNITYLVGGTATGATVSGLPAGVFSSYSAGIVTIYGAPAFAGTYNYTVTTTGSCGVISATGTITVTQQTVTLSSAAGTNNQTVCINNSINTIAYTVGGTATGATVTGLPPGVTSLFNVDVLTISGTPTVAGNYTYTVTTTGTCTVSSVTGTIQVQTQTITLTSGSASTIACKNAAMTPITYTLGGSATGATVTGLPAGISGSYNAGNFTISGTATVSGSFGYTVTTTGTCTSTTTSGSITIQEQTLTLTSANNIQTICRNSAISPITYNVGGTATGASVTGLPAGVTGAYNAGVFTISGTASANGVYNFTVTGTGTCTAATATGTLTVNGQSITLSSATGTNAQTPCKNTPINNITYAIGGTATGATVTGLPAGVSGNYNAGVFTISGTPTTAGNFSYTVTSSGTCAITTATGTINVLQQTINVSGSSSQSVCQNIPISAIQFNLGGSATSATVSGLPAGITGSLSGSVFTISGMPTVSGSFPYTVTTSGSCTAATASGTITVNPAPVAGTIANVSVCYGGSGMLNLNGYTGTISSWEQSTDGGTTWSATGNTTATQSFTNAQQTTLYRANVSLGGCGSTTTANAKLGIHNLWVGSTSSDWRVATNWSDDQLPSSGCSDIIIPAVTGPAVYPVLTGGSEQVNNIVIRSGASLTVTGATLKLAGTISNSGSLFMSNGSLELNGNAPQSIAGSYFHNHLLKNLIISNNNAVSLTGTTDTLKLTGTLSFGTGNALFQTNDHLTLVSNQYGTANVGDLTGNGQYSGNDISGNVTVERYIPNHPKAWQYLAAPTIGQTIKQSWQEGNGTLENAKPGYGTTIAGSVANALAQGFDFATSTPSMKVYDPSTNNWVGVASTSLPIANKKGYMLFVRGDRSVTTANGAPTALTLRTTGHLYTTGTNAPQVSSVPAGKFESIGNPYASALDYSKLSFTGGVQSDVFYVWDPLLTIRTDAGGNSAYGYGGFQTFYWNGNGFDVTPGGGSYTGGNTNIESGQAFMVYAPLSSGTVAFNESAKVDGSASVNRVAGQPYAQLRTKMFAMTQGTRILLDGNTVQFDSAFSNDVDARDALKATNTNESLGLKRDNKRLAVERHNAINSRDTLFFDMGMLKVQQYQFEFIPSLMEEPGLTAYLEDRYLNNTTVISLSDTTRYTFNVINVPGAYASDRFRIVFARTAVTVLPVNIVSVAANRNTDKTVAVRWKTENETSMRNYVVERSENGRDFEGVLTADPKANNGGSAAYAVNDLTANTNELYYRIKALSQSGQIQYSAIVKVAGLNKASDIEVYPNPVKDKILHLQFSNMKKGDYALVLIHSNGVSENLGRIKLEIPTETKSIHLPKTTATGIYQLKLINPEGEIFIKSIQVVE